MIAEAKALTAREVALQICAEIREENCHKPLSLPTLLCWGSIRYSRGDPNKMCLNHERSSGCNLVNARYPTSFLTGVR